MVYSQKNLLELIKGGNFSEAAGKPKQHIETVISNVFLYNEAVYKIYKNNNEFFNQNFRDISSQEDRFDFTTRDFNWNNTLSPTIYLNITGIKISGDKVIACDIDEAEEIAIVMSRVQNNDFLYEKLLHGTVSLADAEHIGQQFGVSIARVQRPVADRNYYDNFKKRLRDLREWLKLAEQDVDQEERDQYCNFLDTTLERNKEDFENKYSSEMTKDGDIHSHNAVLTKDGFHLLDTFPPKEEWSNGHPAIAFYRLGTDIRVFGQDEKLFDAFLKGYQEKRGDFSRALESFYTIYVSSIMLSYQYHLAVNDPKELKGAKLYHQFMQEYFQKHCL